MGTKFIRLLLLGLIILSLRTSLANTHTLKIGINAFEKQLHTAYIQHSRFAIINKDFQEIFDEKIENEEIDFLTDTEMVYQKVQKFLNLKIEALKKLTITAEDTSAEVLQKLSHIKYKTFYARLQDNIGQYVIDAKICKEHRLRLNDSLVTGSTFENILSEDDPRSKSKAGVHVAVESYHCLEGLIKDFNWTAHPNLRHTFVENEKNDDQISRQYIGTYSGLTKLYPAKAWVVEPKIYTYDLYDPRYRPWFYAAESAPKDILLLLDFSGSAKGQTQHLTKMTVLHVLSTLNPNDYINAIWFNSRKDLVMKNCFEGFVPATTRNKRLLRNLLENIEDKDQAFIGPALEMSYDQFIKLTNMSDTYSSGGHKLIMLFSDGIEEWPVSVIKNYTNDHPDEIVRIFGFSMGYGVGEQPPLNWMACKTDAEYTIIDSVADVKLNSRFYLDKLSEVLSHSYRANPQIKNRPISFTTPYMDAQKHGAVLSLSMPILNKADKDSNGFIGVAGIDFKLSSLADLIKLPNSNFYAFIIDNNGIVYYHPKLKIPKNDYYAIRRTACRNIKNKYRHGMRVVFGKTNEEVLKLMGLTDSIPTTDILEIEYYSKKFEEFRTNMIDQHCGEVIEDDTREYRCLVLEGTPLIIGFVYRKEEPTFKFAEAPQNFVVHPSFNDITYYDTDMKTFCNRSLADNDSINKIVEMASYTDNRCKDEQTVFFHYLNAIANWVNSWYGKQGNINNCSSIHIPRDFNQKHYYLSFIQTRKNFNVVFPDVKCMFVFRLAY
uniref:VWFA domain-containing protein n=1 Tax=Rhabditophanes sp. KR3021 TaxID=114890 RepID=A0AC35U714_9BILA